MLMWYEMINKMMARYVKFNLIFKLILYHLSWNDLDNQAGYT